MKVSVCGAIFFTLKFKIICLKVKIGGCSLQMLRAMNIYESLLWLFFFGVFVFRGRTQLALIHLIVVGIFRSSILYFTIIHNVYPFDATTFSWILSCANSIHKNNLKNKIDFNWKCVSLLHRETRVHCLLFDWIKISSQMTNFSLITIFSYVKHWKETPSIWTIVQKLYEISSCHLTKTKVVLNFAEFAIHLNVELHQTKKFDTQSK